MKVETKERIKNMIKDEVPDGYKKIGSNIIPRDWDCEKISKLVTLISGQHIEVQEYNTIGEGIPYLTGPADFNERVITTSKYTKKPKVMCRNGDILITVKGSGVGKTIISDGEYCISRQLMAIRGPKHILEMLYHNLKLNETIYNTDSVGLIPGINRSDILNKKIPLPCNDEEVTKIATILSTWDKAIELKTQLIEEKKQQKKGLAKKLLTGEVRLPGFDGEWKEVRIEDIAIQSTQKNTENQEIRVLSCTKYDGLVDSLEYFGRKMFSEDISKYKLVKKEEICYATNHIEEGSIGILDEYDIGLVSPMYTVFRIDIHYNSGYIFRILKSDSYVELYKSLMSASVNRRGSLRWKEFSKIKIKLPPADEQIEISNFMDLMDKNLKLLEQELTALKLQKKGLLQLLLTGIVRVQC